MLTEYVMSPVRTSLLEQAVERAKHATANISEAELTDLIDDAIQWARQNQ